MQTPASIARHPIHPMLVTFPIGLWIFSLICDIVFLTGSHAAVWATVAFYSMAGGILGALAAAVPGLIDLFSLKSQKVRRLGFTHMAINLTAVVLYAINIYLRISDPARVTGAFALSVAGVALIAVSGWIGGEIVHVHGVGVVAHGRERLPVPKSGCDPRTEECTRWETDEV
jgi:uncharacterized membrane protein